MRTDVPQAVYLKDYQPYPFHVKEVDLTFSVHDGYTIVRALSRFEAKGDDLEVVLDGEDTELLALRINGAEFSDFTKDEAQLRFIAPAPAFTLEIETRIVPERNTRLEGLYMSGGNYCTQCEAQGFRRITYWPDRPDVLSVYTVRVEADRRYPVLLSNGNLQEAGDCEGGRHFSVWHDPWPKPCYLFALVAGDLERVHDTFVTASGRKVDLNIYVRKCDEPQCGHAMESLKKSMKWDEDTYGLEYDLDQFNIVAVSDFNMGAMENKSLNIFNTALVLAHPDTATDADFGRVESVIAHEYFHNWSGNRVTCRDWFQLSLKEGLTVFRDQEFSADMGARSVQRIDDVTHLRRMQFPEDAGPLAHPIRPDSYIEINNFYTMTVYEKGAEVIRMLRTILGAENYRKGTDLYFSRHDGQAVTCEDFVRCMEEASGADLAQFRLWYEQAGTPEVSFSGVYDEAARTYSVTLRQSISPTPGQPTKKPMHIPVSIVLLGSNGASLAEEIVQLREAEQTIVYRDVPSRPVPSVLRGFSAPVKLKCDLSDTDLRFLMLHEADGFNRWEAVQRLYASEIIKAYDACKVGAAHDFCAELLAALGGVLEQSFQPDADASLLARMIVPPAVGILEQSVVLAEPPLLHEARKALMVAVKRAHKPLLQRVYEHTRGHGPYSLSPQAVGGRALRNASLELLTSSCGSGCSELARSHYDAASNMTDRVAALSRLTDMDSPDRAACFGDFYQRFKTFPLVVDKWFSLQAVSVREGLMADLRALKGHPDFNIKNPNRARSLLGAFAMNNPARFHAADGSGYEFLADAVIELNAINPQIAARLLTPMRGWKNYSADRQALMRLALERILRTPDLAPDVFEIASKSLNA